MYKSIKNIFTRKRNISTEPEIYTKYSVLTQQNNISGSYIILSFDCDTPLDAEAAEKISNHLTNISVPAVFAVPGQILRDMKDIYRKIADSGFEFINHGYLNHAAFDYEKKIYYSITWYHEMDDESVRQDIRNGHDCIVKELGLHPKGFRAPHFGYFQKPEQLEIIYTEIEKLRYAYSSTTMPEKGLLHGAVYPVMNNILEFPVTGTYDNPYTVLDSWQFIAAPDRIFTEQDYIMQFRKMIDFFYNKKLPCILNFYVDPLHVVQFEGFYDCINYALKKNYIFTTYTKLLSAFIIKDFR